ncbi:MAG: MgtC/SapB family protein [Bacteroidota bacterium]|nr:MgtC/SapB family protein [Bacteroidota bacterium]
MYWDFVVRIVVAALLGGAIGLEREYHAKEAGFRTHVLVAVGATLFMIISQYGFEEFLGHKSVSFDPSRIASQVVTGMGFLGAGTIIFQRKFIRGLTTAAGIWVTGAIGLAVGCKMYFLSIATTIIVLLALSLLNFGAKRLTFRHLSVVFSCKEQGEINKIIDVLQKDGFVVRECSVEKENTEIVVSLELKAKRYKYNFLLPKVIDNFKDVKIISLQ